MSYIKKIQILAGDVVDLKPKLKEKKADDKEKKQESIKPDFSKAKMRITTSSAYAGGYELSVSVPVSAEFTKDKKKYSKGEFVTLLHKYVNDRIGKWMGEPYLDGFDARAKNGMVTVTAIWHFDDAYFAYALGLDLAEWRSSADVVEKHQIAARQALAEKAMKELEGFRSLAQKKLKLRSQNEEEQDKIWKEEFMEDWVKLDKKWREKGISYSVLIQHTRKERAVGFVAKIQKIVGDTITTIDFRHSIEKIKNFKDLPTNVQDAIKAADHIESKGFQELLGYDKSNKLMWSAGGHWDGHENKSTEKFIVQNFGGMPCPHCTNKSTVQWSSTAEDPIWTENKEIRKLLKTKVKGITKIEDGAHGITGMRIYFPTHTVEVTVGYDKNMALTYDAFRIVDGSAASSKTNLKSRDEVVKAVTDLSK